MAEIKNYRIVLYGASSDKPGLKGKIELYAGTGTTAPSLGKIRFHEGELPADSEEKGGRTVMNVPASMLGDVVDVLRNEKPIYFAFHEGRAVFGTGIEPIGSRDETRVRPSE